MKNITVVTPVVSLVAALATLSGCRGISTAPPDSPRVELEIAVDLDDSYTAPLAGVGADLEKAIIDLVLAKADVGLRFYPVPGASYAEGDPRPPYLLTVDLRDLDVLLEHRTVRPKEGEPFIETSVGGLRCVAATTLTRRRDSGPALTVGRSSGDGAVTVRRGELPEGQTSYTVRRDSEHGGELKVTRAELVAAVAHALDPALRGLVEPADRELAQVASPRSAPHAAPPASGR